MKTNKSFRVRLLDNSPDGPYNMLVIDGPPEGTGRLARYPAGPLLFDRLAPGAAVFLDDADREDEQEIVLRWAKKPPGLTIRRHDSEKGCVVLELNATRT